MLPQRPPHFPSRINVLRAAGLGLSGYLALVPLLRLPCLGGDCGAVLHSSWAHPLGIPLGFYGVTAWLLVLLAPGPARHLASHALALGSLALIAVQAFALRHYCPWCLAHAALALAAWPGRDRPAPARAAAFGLGLTLPLLGGHFLVLHAQARVANPAPLARAGFDWLGAATPEKSPVLVASLSCPRCLDLLEELAAHPLPAGTPRPRLVFLTHPENQELTRILVANVLAAPEDPPGRFASFLAILVTQRELVASRPEEAARWFAFASPPPAAARAQAGTALLHQQAALRGLGLTATPLLIHPDGTTHAVLGRQDLE